MGGRMDGYVAKAVFGAYGAGLVFLILMTVVFDLLFNLSMYLDAADERGQGLLSLAGDLVVFYTVSIPYFFVTIAPFVTVIAGMFAISRLMGANEIVPMIFTGRNMVRVLRPLIFVGVMSGVTMVVCWQFVIPPLSQTYDGVRAQLVGEEARVENLTVRLRENVRQTLIVESYDHAKQRMSGISYLDEGSSEQDEVLVTAAHADWNPDLEGWDLTDGWRHTGGRQSSGRRVQLSTLVIDRITPALLWRTSKEDRELLTLSYGELLDLQALRPGRRDFVLAFHAHLTFPLANLILLMLALPFSVHFERGRRLERVLFAVVVCALYLLADLTCQNLGRTEWLHPMFAAWLPPIFFGSLGVVFFSGVRT